MSRQELGQVLAVEEETQGGNLSQAEVIGATTLHLEDVGDFHEGGGTILLGGSEQKVYDTLDDDLNTLHTTAGLAANWGDDTTVTLIPPGVNRIAHVLLDGDAAVGEPLRALIPNSLYDRVPLGIRDESDQEWVRLEHDGQQWAVKDILGKGLHIDPTLSLSVGMEHVEFTIRGIIAVASGSAAWECPFSTATIKEVRARVKDAPTGADMLIDVNKNGTTIFTDQSHRVTIAAGTQHAISQAVDVSALVSGDYLTIDVDQVGSTTPGTYLVVVVKLQLSAADVAVPSLSLTVQEIDGSPSLDLITKINVPSGALTNIGAGEIALDWVLSSTLGLYVPKSLVTAKGDLIGATASGVPARVPIGADNAFMVADAAQTLGLKWLLRLLASQDVQFTGDITPAQITATQNDYNPTGLATAAVLRVSSDAARDVTGLQGGADGRILILHNVGAFSITLKDEGAGSTAANRFALAADLVVKADGACIVQYDSTSSRWRVIAQSDVGTGGGGATSPLTTKGDMWGFSSADARVPIGSDNAFFVADAAQTLGLKWLLRLLASQDVQFTGDITPSQITANQNDYNPTSLATSSTLRLSADAARDITGLQGGADGRLILIHNVGAFNITLKDENAGSTAANRFALAADLVIKPDGACALQYDSTSSRWRVIGQSDIGSGGTGASTADHFLVVEGGEADTDLSNKLIIPGLSASPDKRVAGANDWEFDSNSLTGWSTFAGGGAVSINDADTTIKSHLYVKIASNGATDKFSGLIHAAPAVPYTVTGKLAARIIGGGWPCLFVSDSATGAGAGVFVGAWDGNGTTPASIRGGTLTNLQTFAGFVDSGKLDGVTVPLYCRIVVTAANNVTIQISCDGLIWYNLHSGYTLLASAGYFGVCNDGFSFTTEMAWDWIRLT